MTTPDSPVLRHFAVDGMDCAEEVATLRDALRNLLPPDQVGFDLLNGRISVPARIPTSQIVTAVAATGMRAVPWTERAATDRSHRRLSGRAWLVLAGR